MDHHSGEKGVPPQRCRHSGRCAPLASTTMRLLAVISLLLVFRHASSQITTTTTNDAAAPASEGGGGGGGVGDDAQVINIVFEPAPAPPPAPVGGGGASIPGPTTTFAPVTFAPTSSSPTAAEPPTSSSPTESPTRSPTEVPPPTPAEPTPAPPPTPAAEQPVTVASEPEEGGSAGERTSAMVPRLTTTLSVMSSPLRDLQTIGGWERATSDFVVESWEGKADDVVGLRVTTRLIAQDPPARRRGRRLRGWGSGSGAGAGARPVSRNLAPPLEAPQDEESAGRRPVIVHREEGRLATTPSELSHWTSTSAFRRLLPDIFRRRDQATSDTGGGGGRGDGELTLYYQQEVSYTFLASDLTAEDLALVPFNTRRKRYNYIRALEESSSASSSSAGGGGDGAAYERLSTVSLVRTLPPGSGPFSDDSTAGGAGTEDESLLLYIILAAAGGGTLLATCFALCIWCRCRRRRANENSTKIRSTGKGHRGKRVRELKSTSTSSSSPSKRDDETSFNGFTLADPMSGQHLGTGNCDDESMAGYTYGDASIASVDYDYSKTFGAAVDEDVSVAEGTLGDGDPSFRRMPPHNLPGDDSTSSFDRHFNGTGGGKGKGKKKKGVGGGRGVELTEGETFDVVAPPGKLGMALDRHPVDGTPFVHAIQATSSVAGKLRVGDKVVALDGINVRALTPITVSTMICRRGDNPKRTLTVVRPRKSR